VLGLKFRVTTVRLSEETLKELKELTKRLKRDQAGVMREALRLGVNEMKIRLALELYSKGEISFGRMAELTGLGYRELFLELKKRNVPIKYGEERFIEEVRELVS
jgi:predicted HTH domain antitoxin